MPQIPECDRCVYYARDYRLVCALHPNGPNSDVCLDFALDPELKNRRFEDFLDLGDSQSTIDNPFTPEPTENWSPTGTRFLNGQLVIHEDENSASYYNGEVIKQPRKRWTPAEQLELLDFHPIFTGRCPQCEMPYPEDYCSSVHWDCPWCKWKDDSV